MEPEEPEEATVQYSFAQVREKQAVEGAAPTMSCPGCRQPHIAFSRGLRVTLARPLTAQTPRRTAL